MFEELMTLEFGEKMIEFNPFETVIAYSLAILIISGLITEYITRIIHTKSIITKMSSFLLLVFVMWHLVFVEDNSLVDSLLIVFAFSFHS